MVASLLNIRLRTYSTYIHRELASREGHVLQLFAMEWTGNKFGHSQIMLLSLCQKPPVKLSVIPILFSILSSSGKHKQDTNLRRHLEESVHLHVCVIEGLENEV